MKKLLFLTVGLLCSANAWGMDQSNKDVSQQIKEKVTHLIKILNYEKVKMHLDKSESRESWNDFIFNLRLFPSGPKADIRNPEVLQNAILSPNKYDKYNVIIKYIRTMLKYGIDKPSFLSEFESSGVWSKSLVGLGKTFKTSFIDYLSSNGFKPNMGTLPSFILSRKVDNILTKIIEHLDTISITSVHCAILRHDVDALKLILESNKKIVDDSIFSSVSPLEGTLYTLNAKLPENQKVKTKSRRLFFDGQTDQERVEIENKVITYSKNFINKWENDKNWRQRMHQMGWMRKNLEMANLLLKHRGQVPLYKSSTTNSQS